MGEQAASETGFYGQRIADAFHIDAPPTLRMRALKKAPIAVTELRCDRHGLGMTSPIMLEDAFAVAVQLQPYCGRLWVAGRPVSTEPMQAGSVSIYDISKSTIADLQTSFRCLQFYLPTLALEAVARDAGARSIGGLRAPAGGSIVDPIVHSLGQSLLPSLAAPDTADPLFVDHVSWALTLHMCRFYADMRFGLDGKRASLALRQQRLVKEAMAERLDGAITLAELAQLCGLSISHFARAFSNTVGTPPYRWLLQRRLDRAMELLQGPASLADIALACGFADQSHFTKTFTRHIGVSPGEWRRQRRR